MGLRSLHLTIKDGKVRVCVDGGLMPSDDVLLTPREAENAAQTFREMAVAARAEEARIVEDDIARLEVELATRRTDLDRMKEDAGYGKPGDLKSDLADAQARLAQPTSPPTDQLQRDTSGARASLGAKWLTSIEDAIFDGTNKPVIVIADALTLADLTESVTYAMIENGDPALSIYPTTEEAREARLVYTPQDQRQIHFCSMPKSFLSRAARFAQIVNAGLHRLDTDEGNLFDLAEKRTQSFIGGKIVMFFDVNDTHIAEASRQCARARVFRLPFTKPGS